jgi:outer membrane protein assembly factor BamC
MPTPTLNQTSRLKTWVGAAAWSRLGLVAAAALIASGCSMLQEDKIDYKSAQRGSTLDVPPDLTQLNRESRYNVPGTTVTASGYQAAQPAQATAATTAMAQVGDVRIERAGNQRWLVVNRPADKLWSPVRDFWQENGFLLDIDQETLGIMETDWAENRAKLPQDFIRSTIGKVFESLYSTGERDRFRTRLERTANGGTEIYISHRGMVEVYSSKEKDQTVWQPRPADVELETEFLRRMMVKLGVTEAQAQAVTATAPAQAAAKVTTVNNVPVVQFVDNFDRAWRRVGRWTAPDSRWKTVIAAKASTSFVMSNPSLTPRNRASLASCSAAPRKKRPPSVTRSSFAAQTPPPPSRCWVHKASPMLPRMRAESRNCWLTT